MEAEQQQFKLGDFEGPLDLLLFLIRKNEVNIYDIPIASITEQFLSYLEYRSRIDLEVGTDFYTMAATLLYIKSQMLLPEEVDFDDSDEDPRKDLVEQLIEYQKFKRLTSAMQEQEEKNEWFIERSKKQRPLPFEDDGVWEEIDVWDLLQTFSTIMSSLSFERVVDLYEEVSVNEKITLINELIEREGSFSFNSLIANAHSIMDFICAFLAVLETVKMKQIRVLQNQLFGDIRITRYQQENEYGT